MNQAFVDYFRCPYSFAAFERSTPDAGEADPGFFGFGPGLTCYGDCNLGVHQSASELLPDALQGVQQDGQHWNLPFNPSEVAENLRLERYVSKKGQAPWKKLIRTMYYALRPLLPVILRRYLQRIWLRRGGKKEFPHWPVDRSVDLMFDKLMSLVVQTAPSRRIPFIWFWPEGKSSCAIVTHDVETAAGLAFAEQLMDITEGYGIRSSFQIIPDARYVVTERVLSAIRDRGFEVNVHDLKHDGHLFDNREDFLMAAKKINQFAKSFRSKGFRAGVLYRNQEWFHALDLSYDMSVPNVGHLDPQSGGCCTVMPFFVGDIVELPVTTTQDYSLFHILGTYSQELWLAQMEAILEQHGLMSFIIHPDYLNNAEARNAYDQLLATLSSLRESSKLWVALPGEVDIWWRQRNEMTLVLREENWCIEGHGAERARLAYAILEGDNLRYVLP